VSFGGPFIGHPDLVADESSGLGFAGLRAGLPWSMLRPAKPSSGGGETATRDRGFTAIWPAAGGGPESPRQERNERK